MYRITHGPDVYIARNIAFDTETQVMTGGAHDVTHRVDHIQALHLGHVTHINGDPVPENYLVPPISLSPHGAPVTVEAIEPQEAA